MREVTTDDSSTSSRTDWARINAMTDDQIDTSDVPPLSERFFATATLRPSLQPGVEIRLTVDSDVVEWFQSLGEGWEQRATAALRLYAATHSKLVVQGARTEG